MTYSSQIRRRFYPIAVIAVGLVATAFASTTAQVPVALVHGFNEGNGIWENVTDEFDLDNLNVYGLTPSINDLSYLDSQANELNTFLVNNSVAAHSHIAVGHSNGGLVSRWLATKSRYPRGIITFGTPHTGAPIINAIPSAISYLGQAIWAVDSYITAQILIWTGSSLEAEVFWALQAGEAALAEWIFPEMMESVLAGYLPSNQIKTDVVPGSTFLYNLNEANGIADQNIPARIGIRVRNSNWFAGGPAAARGIPTAYVLSYLSNTAGGAAAVYGYMLLNSLDEGNYQYEYEYWLRFDLALSVMALAYMLFDYEYAWCSWINGSAGCGQSDGFIPIGAQWYTWAGGSDAPLVEPETYGHAWQQHDPVVYQAISTQTQRVLTDWF